MRGRMAQVAKSPNSRSKSSLNQVGCRARMGYGYHWWAVPHGPTGIHAGAFLAAGSFGQYVYVHPTARVVAAVQSAAAPARGIGLVRSGLKGE